MGYFKVLAFLPKSVLPNLGTLKLWFWVLSCEAAGEAEEEAAPLTGRIKLINLQLFERCCWLWEILGSVKKSSWCKHGKSIEMFCCASGSKAQAWMTHPPLQ